MKYKKKILINGLISKRKLPANYKKDDLQFFKNEFEKIIGDTFLYELNNVCITEDGVVFNNFQVFSSSLHHKTHLKWLNRIYIILTILFKKKIEKKGTYFLGFNYWGEGYFHWLLEELPRIYCSNKIKQEHTVLLPSKWNSFYSFRTMLKSFIKGGKDIIESDFYHESINLLNLKSKEIFPKNSYISVKKLLMPSYTAPTGNYNDVLIQEINNHLLQNQKIAISNNKYSKIYISRKKAARRKIINEKEVEELLANFGYKSLCFEDLSFIEQVSLAANCKILISLHGAGLSNMLFMKESTNVVELRAKGDTQNLCYYSLASALNINYYYLFCKKTNIGLSVQDADIFVDFKKLNEIIKQIK